MGLFMKIVIFLPLAILVLLGVIFGPRVLKDIQKKLNYANTYAIQNVETGKAIRVHNAGNEDGTAIILYAHHNWECITWQLIQLEDNAYLLKNLYTQKTFQPSSSPESGVGLWQQSMGGSRLQYWELIEQANETYFIRLKNSELYLTAEFDGDNAPVILRPKQNSDGQLWRLVRQNPII